MTFIHRIIPIISTRFYGDSKQNRRLRKSLVGGKIFTLDTFLLADDVIAM